MRNIIVVILEPKFEKKHCEILHSQGVGAKDRSVTHSG